MHDPCTVAFEVRRPWPQRSGTSSQGWRPSGIVVKSRRGNAKQHGGRPYYFTPFLVWRGRRWYFPALITVWHVDPEVGGDDDSCRHRASKRWGFQRSFFVYKLHVHHWSVQVHPWQKLRRWLFVRCAGCGRRFPWSYAPISFHWEGQGDLFHHDQHAVPGQPPCSLMHQKRTYDAWKVAYPDMVGGEFDRGDPFDRWADLRAAAGGASPGGADTKENP